MADDTLSHPAPGNQAQRYHHGNLPDALVSAAHDLIEESGLASLTLRAVAQRVGVTHAAPYRHFKDKAALVAAVAARSLEELVACIAQETDAVGAAVAYVRHATEHRGSYAIIFTNAFAASQPPPALLNGFAALLPNDLQQSHLPAAIWSLCHGLTACVNADGAAEISVEHVARGAAEISVEHVAREATRSLVAQ